MRRKIAVFVLCVFLAGMLALTLSVAGAEEEEMSGERAVQEPGGTQYQRIMDTIETEGYPSYYGGAYFSDEDTLVILMTEITQETRADIRRRAGEGPLYAKPAQYTWEELQATMDLIQKAKESGQDIPLFYSWWISDQDNRVVVALEKLTPQETAKFRKTVSDSPMIVFEQGWGMNADY